MKLIKVLIIVVASSTIWGEGFYQKLMEKPQVSAADAIRMASLVLKEKGVWFDNLGKGLKPQEGYPPSVLLARELLSSQGIDLSRVDDEETATYGFMGQLMCQVLDIKGGLVSRILGPTKRYSLREMNHLKLMAGKGMWHHLTGKDLLAIVSRSADYYRKKPGGEK